MIYLDWAATTPTASDVLEEMSQTAEQFPANPSSGHTPGKEASAFLKKCRIRCATILDCEPEQLIFTSGGSESDNMILYTLFLRQGSPGLITTTLEHPAVGLPAGILKKMGITVHKLKPEISGFFSPERLTAALSKKTRMISLIALHNETGAIQPLKLLVQEARKKAKELRIPLHIHSDMVQTPGKIPLSLDTSGLDSASFSAHKFRGPRGVGLLYLRKKEDFLYQGGGQEQGFRPGTENLPGIAGMTLALEQYGTFQEQSGYEEKMNLLIEQLSTIPGARILPENRRKEPNRYSDRILMFAFPSVPGEVLQRVLDSRGFAVSTGSACSTNKKSHTSGLISMGIPKETAECSIRIAPGPDTTTEELMSLCKAIKEEVSILSRAGMRNKRG